MSVTSIIDICSIILILCLIAIGFYYQARKRRTMGQILFQYPISKTYKKIFFCFAIVWFAGFVSVSVVWVRNGWQPLLRFWPSIYPISIWLVCMHSMSGFEIRVAGILFCGKFTKWEALTAFQWKAEGDFKFGFGKEAYILGLYKSGDRFPWWLEWNKFQRDQREEVDRLLSQYLPKAT